MSKAFEYFKTAVDRFEIGDPIKSVFNPKFKMSYDFIHDEIRVVLKINATCSVQPGRIADVKLERLIPAALLDLAICTAPNYCNHVAKFLRNMLNQILSHEIDESISVNGKRIFDPHKNE